MKTQALTSLFLCTVVLTTSNLQAEELPDASQAVETSTEAPDSDSEALAKQLANPVASLISVPFQNNWDFGIGVNDASRYTLNFQPVTPFAINDDYNLIVRTIVPIIDAESPAPGIPNASGLGDIVQTFFVSPVDKIGGDWILGVGPAFLYPSASSDFLGLDKWGAGPSVVALRQDGPWTSGILVNHLWSFAGDSQRSDVDATFLNPFLTYITDSSTTFALSPELTYDWERDQWNAPINFVVSQLLKVGDQPIQLGLGARYYADGPAGGPEWGIRANLVLLFAK